MYPTRFRSPIGPQLGLAIAALFALACCNAQDNADAKAYPNMPPFAPPNTRVESFLPVPDSALGPAIDPAKGYHVAEIRNGAYWITDGGYQAMFVVTSRGVIAVDAPPAIGDNLVKAIHEVTPLPITHVIYSHSHIDHIGSAYLYPGNPIIIAHDETAALLRRANDPHRPVPSVTFGDSYRLEDGGQVVELTYPGPNHEPGNILIRLPQQKVAMLVDVVYPGWMMWRQLGVAKDVAGLFVAIDRLLALDFETVVTGHVSRLGTRADVQEAKDFLTDLKAAAAEGLMTVDKAEVAADMTPEDAANPWAFYRGFIDRVVIHCVNRMTPTWRDRLAAYDVWIYDQCIAMEQSLRID